MTINFENYGKFYVAFFYDDDTHSVYDGQGEGYTLKEAADFISENMENGFSVISADIVDFETGEIVASLEREEPEEEDWYDYRDDYDEIGFNPYMGCYDFDCQSRSRPGPKVQEKTKNVLDNLFIVCYNVDTKKGEQK